MAGTVVPAPIRYVSLHCARVRNATPARAARRPEERRVTSKDRQSWRTRASRLAPAALACLLAAAPAAQAQVPTGFQEYHVVGKEQHVWDMFNRPVVGQPPVGYTLSNAVLSVVAATVSSANQVIYYDHWEDNVDVDGDGIPDFELDIVNAQTQPNTLVLGDGNPANGDACTFIAGACAGDIINLGDTLTLNSDQNTGTGAAPNCGAGANLQGCVPINPRVATDIRFDGGDRMLTSGGPVSLVHIQEPIANLGGILGGAVEIVSRQAVGPATSYSVPVGQDSPTNLGTAGNPFVFVDLNLVAFEDNTSVVVTSPGAGSVSFTLNAGEHWTSQGDIDNFSDPATLALVINEGTKVSTDKPLSGLIFASALGTYATRVFALLPDLLHSTDYITTAPGDDPTVAGSRTKEVYVYNPDPVNAMTVTFTDALGSGTFPVAPNSTVAYSNGTGAGRNPPAGSTVRLTSDRNFWGVTAYDSQGTAHDWGHSWLAVPFLTETYTVPFAPDNPASPPGASPIFISATTDNTCVKLDFDNDGVFDQIGDGAGGLVARDCDGNMGYTVNAPGSAFLDALRVYDNNAADGTPNDDPTGARVVANKPVALAYGLDTDQAPVSGAGILDLGYWVYPVNQAFLEPVMTIEKTPDVGSVPSAGAPVTYTLEVRAYSFGPLSGLDVRDLLPSGVPGSSYVPGSTVITNPDLSTVTGAGADPTITTVGSRDELDWTSVLAANVDTLAANESLTIQYTIDIPAGAPAVLTNEVTAVGSLGASVFAPTDSADVVRTDVSLAKAVTDDGSPEVNETLTYTLTVANGGVADETNVFVSDSIPGNATFVPGSIVDAGPFTGTYDPGQNAVVWSAAAFTAGTGPFALSFQVRVNPATPSGTAIDNVATYESNETQIFSSNQVSTTVVGPSLLVAKSAVGNPDPVYPGQIVIWEITVENVGGGAANNLVIEDPFPLNGTYVAESMEFQLNAGSPVALTDAGGDDEGELLADRLRFGTGMLGAGEDLTFRFSSTVDAGSGGADLGNQATVSSDEVSPVDTNLVLIPIVGDATVTGHLFIDLDDDGVQDPGEPNLADVDVVVTDEDGGVQVVTTDVNGDYQVVVPADGTGSTSLDVDETDPDFPSGATLCTASPAPPNGCTDPQVVTATSGGTVAALNVGYVPAAISVTKTSDAGAGVVPGDVIGYTVVVDNTSGVNQSAVTVTDPVPANTTFLPGTTQVSAPAVRVTEYFVGAGAFPPDGSPDGNPDLFTLTLDQDLAADYFVIVQGSDGNGSGSGTRSPEDSYIALTGDPAGTGALAATGAANQLQFTRGGDGNDGWEGVVTVVESLPNAGADGFTLLDVQRVSHGSGAASGAVASGTPWTTLGQVMLVGGFNGAGCETAETSASNHPVCWTRLFPSGASTVNWTRSGTTSLNPATSTVMVLEWGTDWTVQRANVTGSSGGNGADATTEYNTAAIAPVARASTWVWGTGHTANNGIGNGAEGVLVTLGDGVNTNATETTVAIGKEYTGAMDFEVWALTHPGLAVDQRFLADGNSGSTTVDVTVDAATASRMALSYNGQNGTGTAFPRPMLSARYLDDTTVRLERRRTGQNFPAWIQGIDFSGVESVAAGGVAPNLVTAAAGYELPPGTSMTVTFQVQVNASTGGATSITNTASAATAASPTPVNGSVTDPLFDPGVSVEPNGAAAIAAGGGTVVFDHSVTNTGDATDSYALAAFSAQGYAITLRDPATGGVVAVDSDGDGAWDGGATPNTGSLAPGAAAHYRLEVAVPGSAVVGDLDSVELRASSDLRAGLSASAFDEITVVDGTVPGAADLLVTPDNASFVLAGATVAYTHTVTNNTGATRVFALQAVSDLGFATGIFQDANGDGFYTPGLDTAITNTAALADGTSQRIFVVVSVPAGTPNGTVDTTNITASFNDDNGTPGDPLDDIVFGGVATDTTTVGVPNNDIGFDLSGGGSHVVNAGDTDVFRGMLSNIGSATDRYEFTISASVYGPGGVSADGNPHTSRLEIDTDGDGEPDLVIAEDTDGDGAWDLTDADGDGSLEPAGSLGPGQLYDADGDGVPDVGIGASTALAYDLERPVALTQSPYRDPVTLTATSFANGESDAVSATTAILLATRAVIGDFVAYGTRAGVVVQWQTLSEHGTVGFHLEREDAGTDEYLRVNAELLPGLLHARNGGLYRFVDQGVAVGELHRYLLVEQEATGRQLSYGPYEVEVHADAAAAGLSAAEVAETPVTGYERVARAMSKLERDRQEAKIAARAAASDGRAARTGARAKIHTAGAGLHFVDTATIAEAMGLGETKVRKLLDRGRLRLSNRGQDVAVLPAHGGAGLYFYAEAVGDGAPGAGAQSRRDGLYGDENVYWLERGRALEMATVDAGLPAPVAGGTFMETSRAEGNRYTLTHLFDDPDDDYWMWDFRFGGFEFPDCSLVSPPAPCYVSSYPLASPGRSARPGDEAILTVHLHGGSEVDGDEDHEVTVTLNGVVLGVSTFDGPVPHEIELTVDAASLVDGDNAVEISLAASPNPAQPSIVYVDELTLRYPRHHRSAGGVLEATTSGSTVSIEGFAEPSVWAFDLDDPKRPGRFVNATIDGQAGNHRITVPAPGRVLAVAPSVARSPLRVIADRPSTLLESGNAADHLIITSSDLVDAAGALAAHRDAQGLSSMVVDVEDVYDEFNYGIVNADAIWSFLRHAYLRWERAPRYVVLAGEGSHDYLDHLGNGDSIIPTLLTPTPDGLFPSDNLYADVDGNDFVPEMAIGRLPVIDAAELEAVIAKIVDYESAGGDWTERSLLAADAPDAGGDFVEDSEALAGLFPERHALGRIYLDGTDPATAREAMLEALEEGQAFVNFIGHGGFTGLGNASLLTSGDVASLTNAGRLPVVTAFSCLVGQFGFPGQESLSELLLVDPEDGAAAVWSPSGLSRNDRARILAEGFYGATFDGAGELVIGESILRAQRGYAADDVDRYLLDIYNLIGDPATLMK